MIKKLLPIAILAGLPLSAQVLNDFSDLVGDATYFYGSWEVSGSSAGSNDPSAAFVQGTGADFGTYDLIGGSSDIGSKLEYYYSVPTPAYFDAGTFRFVALNASLLSGNTASSIRLTLLDANGVGASAIFDLASLSTGLISQVRAAVVVDSAVFDFSRIESFVLSGGEATGPFETVSLRLDELSFVETASAIPEPGAYGLCVGLAMAGGVWWRRRKES